MITIRSFNSRQVILNLYENDKITDFYGRIKYFISYSNIKNFSMQVLYKFDGEWITDFYGKMLYKLCGNEFKDFYGRTVLKFEGDMITDFYGRFLYLLDSPLSESDKKIIGTIYMEYGNLENAIK